VTDSADLAAVAGPLLRGRRKERVVVVVCDAAGNVLRTTLLTEGSVDRCMLPVRDVLAVALASGGASFGVAHNHPSGCTKPSDHDLRITGGLAEAEDLIGLRFLDHVVVTDSAWRRVGVSEFTERPGQQRGAE
jgi:DNA repair protein RadC